MIVYWFLLLITSIIAYGLGSMSTMVLASNYVFRTRLSRLGKGNIWISNFRRIYGVWGFVRLLLVELVKDLLPILLGGLLLGLKGHAQVGYVFAGFCLTLGRLFPLFYDFKGSHATFCLILTGMFAAPTVGIATAIVALIVTFLSRYIALGTLAGAFIMVVVSVLMVDDSLMLRLLIFTAALAFIKHIPAITRMLNGREFRLSFEEDITYKLDQKF
ncbi:MAG: glycerol-3-phosphate acyltransferase [Oscillospiraceae bacterium]|nr:glycerol-3-phosphate acyltransferase [Oscillospiraceae bacterium]